MSEKPKQYVELGVDTAKWFDYTQAYDAMADAVPAKGIVVELGVWRGRSLVYLWELLNNRYGASESMPQVVGVDLFRNHERFGLWSGEIDFSDGVMAQISRVCRDMCGHDRFTPKIFVEKSYEAARHFAAMSVHGVWIDAAHDEQSVCADIAAWLPKLVCGGWIGGHDLNTHKGVRAALQTMGLDFEDHGRWWKWTGKWRS